MQKLKFPSTPHDALVNSVITGLQVIVDSNIPKPNAREREALQTAKVNLAINAAPIVLPIAGAIVRDVVTEIVKFFQPQPQYAPLLVTYSPEINELIRRNQGTVIIYHSSQNH